MSRRGFVGSTGLALGALAISGTTAAGESVTQGGKKVYVRRSAHTLAAGSDLKSYAKAVKAMKELASGDRRSWMFQANMHNTLDPVVTPDQQKLWNGCEHGTLFFLSWHRMYVHFFEKICRKMSGDGGFALPYWRYEALEERTLPVAFRLPSDSTNPLYEARRRKEMNEGGRLLPANVTHTASFQERQLGPTGKKQFGFSATVEDRPHGAVHTDTGGYDPDAGELGLMSTPETAAQDPIFWLHHANIDRLWKGWLRLGEGRKNPSDAAWVDRAWSFVDDDGAVVGMTTSDVLNTAAGKLNYLYDDELEVLAGVTGPGPVVTLMAPPAAEVAAATASTQPATAVAATTQPVKLGQEAVVAKVVLDASGGMKIAAIKPQGLVAPVAERFVLRLEGLAAQQPPGVNFDVYVNLPESVKSPSPDSPYYAGSFSYFGVVGLKGGHAGHEHGGGESVSAARAFDVTELVHVLRAKGELKDNADVRVTVLPQASGEGAAGRRPLNPKALPEIGRIAISAE